MSVRPYKDKDGKVVPGKWIIDYYPNGRKAPQVRQVVQCEEGKAREIERQLRQSHYEKPVGVNPRVIDILDNYIEWLKLHRSERYAKDVEGAFKQLKPFFQYIQLSKITPHLISDYKKNRRRPEGIHAGKSGVCSINKELRYLGTFHSWAVKHGYARPLPFKIEKLPYRPAVQEVAHPTDIESFLTEIKPHGEKPHNIEEADRKKALILFLLECALRWIEAVNIRWEDIDFKSDTVYLKITKGDRPDVCFLTERIKGLLEPYRKDSGFVFECRATGRPWKSLRTIFKTASKRAGIKRLKPHQLRRTGATLMLEATGDMRLVQEFLRHKDITTTQIYTKISKARLREGMKKTTAYVNALKEAETIRNIKEKK